MGKKVNRPNPHERDWITSWIKANAERLQADEVTLSQAAKECMLAYHQYLDANPTKTKLRRLKFTDNTLKTSVDVLRANHGLQWNGQSSRKSGEASRDRSRILAREHMRLSEQYNRLIQLVNKPLGELLPESLPLFVVDEGVRLIARSRRLLPSDTAAGDSPSQGEDS